MHPDDHEQHEKYHELAREAHYTSIRKRERMDREEKERERVKSGATDESHLNEMHSDKVDVVDPTKIAKPKPHPTKVDLKHSIISVFIRDRWRGVREDAHGGPAQWMQSAAMALEADFRDHNVNFQEINLHDHEHIQIICNDREERDHMKHILVRQQAILCFYMDGKMVFGKFTTEGEKENFKGMKDYNRRKRNDNSKEFKRLEK